MNNFKNLIACTLLSLSTLSVQAQSKPSAFGKGILNLKGKDNSWSMKVGLRMQTLATSNWEINHGLSNMESNFLVRRARLKFGGFAYSPKLKYKVELGLSNRDMSGASQFTSNSPRYILDAVVKWNFHDNFTLWAGQTKLPGNRERLISSGNLQMVDRSLLNSKFNVDRDVGLQLHHHFNLSDTFKVKEAISISQGEGRNITKGNLGGYEYTGRIEFLPLGDFKSKGDYSGGDLKREQSPKLAIAAAYDFNNNAVKDRGNQGKYMTTDNGFYETNISTIFVDAMFKYKGFSFMGEYAHRDAKNPVARNSDGTATGKVVQIGDALNFQSAYLFKNNYELSARYTNLKFKDIVGTGPQNQYTLGLSKYIVGHKLKIQSDISYKTIDKIAHPLDKNENLEFRLQFDLHF